MKKTLLLALIASSLTNFSQINTGLISQYYFCGNANDLVGSNNGIVRGASLTSDRFGNSNSAYSFNGTNNLINLGTTSSLKSSTMSISLWAKISNYSNTAIGYSNQPFITTRSRNTTANYEAYFMGMYSPTQNLDAATTSSTGVQNSILSTVTASLNVWNHLVYMFTDDSTYLYINGVFQQQVFKGFTSGYLAGDSVTLGYVGSGPSTLSFLNGCLDDIRIYSRTLTSTEITQLFTEPDPKPTINAVTSPTLICKGKTATLSASGASTYTWVPGGAGATITISPTVTTNYSVTGTATNGCSNTSSVTQIVSECVGITSNSTSKIETKIYPNPSTSGVFKLETDNRISIRAINLLGQVVYQSTHLNGPNEIDLSTQKSGVYFLIITSEEGEQSQKLIIEK